LERREVTDSPLVSVIVVTLNRKEDLAEALESLRQQTHRNTEVILVDNGSTDGTAQMVKESFPDMPFIQLGSNTGPYHGRNVGVDASKGDLLFFMDDDATVEKDSLAQIVARFSKEESLGVAVCKLIDMGTGALDSRLHSSVATNFDQEFYMGDMVLEGATAIRKAVFEQVGRWPAHYFRQYVGRDLSYRIIDAGYDMVFLPTATVFHKESPIGGVSRGQIERDKVFYATRNQLWIAWKYLPLPRAALETIIKVCYHFVDALRKGAMIPFLKGLGAAISTMPGILLKERRPITRKALAKIDYMAYGGAITNGEMLETFTPLSLRTLLWRKLITLNTRSGVRKSTEEKV
jgi:GT2 family glycosyltransferase